MSTIFEALIEMLHHFLAKRKLYPVRKMLDAFYRELTVLGFISFSLFTFSTTGFVQYVNDRVFGVSETEAVALEEAQKAGHNKIPPTTLMEIFEEVHIFLFVIMAIFIGIAAYLTIYCYNGEISNFLVSSNQLYNIIHCLLMVYQLCLPTIIMIVSARLIFWKFIGIVMNSSGVSKLSNIMV